MNHSTITPEQQDISTELNSKKVSLIKIIVIFFVTGSILFGIATWIGYKFFWYQPVYESVEDYQFKTALNNVKEYPGNAALRVELGWNYMEIGNFGHAKKEFQNALKIDKTNAGAKINLAMVLTEEEKFEDAKKLLLEVLEKTPALPGAHLTLGQVYLQSKEYDKAIEKFDYLLKSHPGTVDFMANPAGLFIKDEKIYFTDLALNTINILDMDGNVLVSFGGKGEEDGQVLYPHDLTVSNDNEVYVSDSGNNRVLVFNEKAHYQNLQGSLPFPLSEHSQVLGKKPVQPLVYSIFTAVKSFNS